MGYFCITVSTQPDGYNEWFHSILVGRHGEPGGLWQWACVVEAVHITGRTESWAGKRRKGPGSSYTLPMSASKDLLPQLGHTSFGLQSFHKTASSWGISIQTQTRGEHFRIRLLTSPFQCMPPSHRITQSFLRASSQGTWPCCTSPGLTDRPMSAGSSNTLTTVFCMPSGPTQWG